MKIITNAMKERTKNVGVEWVDAGNGYYYGSGRNPRLGVDLSYIALPKGHPDIGIDYLTLDVDVNGGLTFQEDNVYGWDYGHAYNRYDYKGDIERALKFFKSRELKNNENNK
ncbi:MAG: hypothetical protein ACTSXD_08435 [Candidatus Heimdallarchaeaceae archaeon]